MEFVICSTIIAMLALLTLLYTSRVPRFVKLIAVFLCFGAALITYDNYVENLGAPIVGMPTNEVTYIHHRIGSDQKIYLWAYDLEKSRDRLYVFDYSREAAKKLAEAGELAEAGGNPSLRADPSEMSFNVSDGTVSEEQETK